MSVPSPQVRIAANCINLHLACFNPNASDKAEKGQENHGETPLGFRWKRVMKHLNADRNARRLNAPHCQ